jgi:hypothetical protein
MFRKILSAWYRHLPIVKELNHIARILESQHRFTNAVQLAQLVDFQLENHPRFGDPKRLLRFQTQVCSQGHEDGIIHEIFTRIGHTNRVFVEVGVGNGKENNTAFLLSQGWTGFWIDGNSSFQETIRQRADLSGGCLQGHVGYVTRENIASLMSQLGVPKEVDLMSLDIDQNTYYTWEALPEYKPRVVVVEYNAAVPPDVDWKVKYDGARVWNGTQNMGASLKAFELLAARLGYLLVGCDFAGNNAFFVRSDLVSETRFAPPFTALNHYEPPRFTTRRHHPNEILDRRG